MALPREPGCRSSSCPISLRSPFRRQSAGVDTAATAATSQKLRPGRAGPRYSGARPEQSLRWSGAMPRPDQNGPGVGIQTGIPRSSHMRVGWRQRHVKAPHFPAKAHLFEPKADPGLSGRRPTVHGGTERTLNWAGAEKLPPGPARSHGRAGPGCVSPATRGG